jgi:hypothetical protein
MNTVERWALALTWLVACERTVYIGKDDPPTTTTDASGSTTSASTGAAETTTRAPNDVPQGPCALEPDDNACVVCLRTQCCEELHGCAMQDGEDCMCMLDCVKSGNPPEACEPACTPNADSMMLVACVAMSCDVVCP